MIFGRRRRNAGESGAIVEFWAWWAGARTAVEAAVSAGELGPLAGELTRRVQAVHPGLLWELSRGTEARHSLVVSAGGRAELRSVAARWGALALAADPVWEYHTARQPDPWTLASELALDDGTKLDLSRLRFAFAREAERPEVDVVAYHPGFRGLDDQAQGQVTFLTLDWLLGEDGVEEWVGAVAWTADEPEGASAPVELAAAVDALREEYRTAQWVLMTATLPDGSPLIAAAQRPLRAVRWPRFDTHVAVTLPFHGQNPAGLPEAESLAALREFEDTALASAVGGDGELVAHETNRGARTLHYYVDAASPAADDLAEAAGWWRDGRARVERRHDPSFERMARFG